jgi:hypothetical protein
MSFKLELKNWSLFRNTYKKEGTRQPDHKGDANVVCPHCQRAHVLELAGWDKIGRSGPYISGLIDVPKPKEPKPDPRPTGGKTYPANGKETGAIALPDTGFDDDIPF